MMGKGLLNKRPVVLIKRTVQTFGDDDCTHMAAGIAYYALFSIFPLLLGLVAIAGALTAPADVQRETTRILSQYLPGSDALVAETVTSVVESRGGMGGLALIGLLWSGSAIFAAIRRSVNRAWAVEKQRSFLRQKIAEFTMMIVAGLFFLLSVISTTLFETISALEIPIGRFGPVGDIILWQIVGLLLPFVFSFSVFALIYRYVPNTRVYWGDIWLGALLGAVAFEAAKQGFAWYLANLATYNLVYGSLAGVIVLLFWAYVSSLILLFFAEFSSEYARLYNR